MANFDLSKPWIILFPPGIPAARRGGEDLSLALYLWRKRAGLTMEPPALIDGSGPSPDGPLIVLNATPGEERRNGFSWRLGQDRLEIFGDGGRGLCNGIFDFLAALGIRWASLETGSQIQLVSESGPEPYPLRDMKAHRPSDPQNMARRLVFTGEGSPQKQEAALVWAARNQYDAVVFPLEERRPLGWRGYAWRGYARHIFAPAEEKNRESLLSLAASYDIAVERGGWELSILLPRRRFFFQRELFRMEQGKRVKERHFCATNPNTIAIIQREAERLFRAYPETEVFHLWPDTGYEYTWCACPSCRAFFPEEQNRIAVTTAAETLAKLNPQARLSFYENTGRQIDIETWPNMFKLDKFPDTAPFPFKPQ